MIEAPLKVLLIDDDEDDYLLTKELLSEVRGTRYTVTWVSSWEGALPALLAGDHDVCLLDYRLGGRTGLDILVEAQHVGCEVPVIMLTGIGDRELDMAAMAAGASDYIVKGEMDARLLERSIRYSIGHKKSEIELKRRAESLEQKSKRLSQMAAELSQKNEELLRLNEEKNRIVGIAAHDLRNPLGVILGYSDFLLMSLGSGMQKGEIEIIDKIRSSSKFMLSLINDLLDISLIESGRLHLDKKSSDLVRLVEANVGLNMVLASRKQMKIDFGVDPGVPPVDVDPLKVEQVLNNLISNAIHYAPPWTTITVRVQHRSREAIVSVRDQGPGIAPEEIGNLFRPFGRAKTVSTGGERSTGLGLAIARRIVDGHGGRIWVESELGLGSTFFVAFPVTGSATSCGDPSRAG